MKKNITIAFILLLLVKINIALGDVRLPSILSDHMVLQQNQEGLLWGWSDATEKIVVSTSWDTVTYKTTGTRDANWSLKIKTPRASNTSHTITIKGRNTIIIQDVLIGEVWLGSGQSNMEWGMNANEKQTADEAPYAKNNELRFFKVPRTTSNSPQDDLPGRWIVCNPNDLKWLSAVGYYFSKTVHQSLQIPVGFINSSWGGTPAEAWTPKELIENDPALKEASVTKISTGYPGWPIAPGKTYNAMISPITNFAIAGVIWYQGESNVEGYATYQQLLTTMIGAWRKAWSNVFPFYYVQIAPYNYGNKNIGALLREAQTKCLNYPATGMIVITDLVDDVNNIHPVNKRDVGLRLANYALADTYHKAIPYQSPVYKNMKVEKNKIRVIFDHAEKGLISKGNVLSDFYIAGDDKNFIPATAKIDGSTVVVSNPKVKNPVAVRFGFSNTAMPNLFSKDGLPVNFFRTDAWEVNTDPIKQKD
jgi:sialate O-acetylesterase